MAAFPQTASTDLYGREIWADDALLQIDRLKSRWSGLDDFDTINLMHHANAPLCPGTVPS